MAKVFEKINFNEFVTVFASVTIGDQFFEGDASDTSVILENLVYSTLFTFFESRNVLLQDKELKYYAVGITTSIISEAGGNFVGKVAGESGRDRLRTIVKRGVVKYIEVMVGKMVRDIFITGDKEGLFYM